MVPPPGLTGPPLLLQSTSTRPLLESESRGPGNNDALHLPPPLVPVGRNSPGPFRGPPLPVSIDESRPHSCIRPLLPWTWSVLTIASSLALDARALVVDLPGTRTSSCTTPVPQQQLPTEELRLSAHGPIPFKYLNGRHRVPLTSTSPVPHPRPCSSGMNFPPYPGRQPVGPAQPSASSSQRSPPSYPREPRPVERDTSWDRRGPPEHSCDCSTSVIRLTIRIFLPMPSLQVAHPPILRPSLSFPFRCSQSIQSAG